MNLFRRMVTKKRRHLRVETRLPAKIEAANGESVSCWTVDISESGLRMQLPENVGASDLMGGSRSVHMNITLHEGEPPVIAMAELVWANRDPSAPHLTGWMFSHLVEGEERLRDFVYENADGTRS